MKPTERVWHILELYRDKFAMEFTYDDWTLSYRDALHASVLAAAEVGIEAHIAQGETAKAIQVCRRLLSIDPALTPSNSGCFVSIA